MKNFLIFFFKKTGLYILAMSVGFLIACGTKNIVNFDIVRGNSMEPTYKDGQIVLCDNLAKNTELERNKVYIIKSDYDGFKKNLIKRLIGKPGDKISIKSGKVYLNDELLDENYPKIQCNDCEVYLNKNEYYFLGDNRNNSIDSRIIGAIKRENIIKKVK